MSRTIKSIRIRSANEKDISSLALLAEKFMPQEADITKRAEVLKEILKEPDYEVLVAELGETIIGFLDQWIVKDFTHGAKHCYIQNLYVCFEYRQKGVASKLLEEAMRNAKNMGVY